MLVGCIKFNLVWFYLYVVNSKHELKLKQTQFLNRKPEERKTLLDITSQIPIPSLKNRSVFHQKVRINHVLSFAESFSEFLRKKEITQIRKASLKSSDKLTGEISKC